MLYLVKSASERRLRDGGNQVVAFDPDSGAVIWASPADIHGCGGIAVGGGCIFVSSYANSQILLYSAATGRRTAPEMGGRRSLVINSPTVLAFDPLSRVLFVSHQGAWRHHALDRSQAEDVRACRWEGRAVLQQLGDGDVECLRVNIEGAAYNYPRLRPMAVLVDPRWAGGDSDPGALGPSRLVIGVLDSPVLEVWSIHPATGLLTHLGTLDLTGWHDDVRAGCSAAVASRPSAASVVEGPGAPRPEVQAAAPGPARARQATQQRRTAESVRALAADPTGGALLVLTMRGVIAVPAHVLPGEGGV